MVSTISAMEPGKATGPSEVCAEKISFCGKVSSVMLEFKQRVWDEK